MLGVGSEASGLPDALTEPVKDEISAQTTGVHRLDGVNPAAYTRTTPCLAPDVKRACRWWRIRRER
jgi:hypothetical protein